MTIGQPRGCCPQQLIGTLPERALVSVTRCVRDYLLNDLGETMLRHTPIHEMLACVSNITGTHMTAAIGLDIAMLPVLMSECLVPKGGNEKQLAQSVRDALAARVSNCSTHAD